MISSKRAMALFFGAIVLAGCGGQQEVQESPLQRVKVAPAEAVGQLISRRYPGIAKGADEVDLAFRVSGVLEKRPIQQGDVVEKGQLLARLEQQDFLQEIATIEGNVESAKASLRRSDTDFQRLLRIQKKDPGAIDQRSVDLAQQRYESDAADLKSLEAQLVNAQNRLTYTSLLAPFDARVIEIFPENYQRVREGDRVVRLVNYGTTEIVLSIPEVVMPHLDKIERIDVQFEVYPDRTYLGEIFEIGVEASPTTRTYPVTLRLKGEIKETIYPGMAGIGMLHFKRAPIEKVIVPETAQVIDDFGQSFVWILDNGFVRRRNVEVDGLVPKGLLIGEGLVEGEVVVVSGAERLDDGQEVKAITERGWP